MVIKYETHVIDNHWEKCKEHICNNCGKECDQESANALDWLYDVDTDQLCFKCAHEVYDIRKAE